MRRNEGEMEERRRRKVEKMKIGRREEDEDWKEQRK